MATEVILPRVDMDMAEGKIAHWYVKDGDAVRKGQLLFEIETDKATMEVDSPVDGVMHGIRGEVGVTMPVGQVVGWILAAGEAPPSGAAAPDQPAAEAATALAPSSAAPQAETAAVEARAEAKPNGSTLLRATPLARSLARLQGVDLSAVAPSGPNGRILARDLAAAAEQTGAGSDDPLSLHLQWYRRGSGTPMLLIHGFGADQGSWRPLVQQLPESLPVLAVDLPGHGKSEPREAGTMQDLAQAVLQQLSREGVGQCHVLGHSLGGGVAIALAELAPAGMVRSLTLLAPAGLGPDINGAFIDGLIRSEDEAALKRTLATLFHDPAALTGSFVATAFQQLQKPGRRDALAAMAAQLMPKGRQAQNLRETLERLRIPVQVIWGREDRIIPAHHAFDAPAQVALHQLPAVGHLPQVEAAASVAALVTHQCQATV